MLDRNAEEIAMAMSNNRNGVNLLFGSTVQYQGNTIGRAIENWRVELGVKNAVNARWSGNYWNEMNTDSNDCAKRVIGEMTAIGR
eukprot:scaffold13982_cov81-Skeletonema_dohrnii-CCMP3373.AAC.2